MVKGYTGWVMTEETRNRLLAIIPPTYERTIAHHVTYKFGVEGAEIPENTVARIYAIADDRAGVQALKLILNSKGIFREDDSLFHITWSLAEGRKPVESNIVCQTEDFCQYPGIEISSIDIELEGKFFPF